MCSRRTTLDGGGSSRTLFSISWRPRRCNRISTCRWPSRGSDRAARGYIDLGKEGEGPGDLFLTSGVPVRDERTGRRVGEIDGFEVILSRAHIGMVFQSGSLNLRDGSIQGAGIIRHTDAEQAESLTGGTGAYANTRGQMTVREDSRRKVNILTVKLLPPWRK